MARAHKAPLPKRPMLPGRSRHSPVALPRHRCSSTTTHCASCETHWRRVMSRTAQRSRRRLASASPLTATSGSRGKRHQRKVCPATSYLPSTIAKETRGWPQAAAETPGLTWIHARYLDVLRGSGREEAGARRLFVALGAEVVPRLQQVGSFASPVQFWRSELAEPQEAALEDSYATHFSQDWVSPDLDAVLRDIVRQRVDRRRRNRARALFETLDQHWDRFATSTAAQSVYHYSRGRAVRACPRRGLRR